MQLEQLAHKVQLDLQAPQVLVVKPAHKAQLAQLVYKVQQEPKE